MLNIKAKKKTFQKRWNVTLPLKCYSETLHGAFIYVLLHFIWWISVGQISATTLTNHNRVFLLYC